MFFFYLKIGLYIAELNTTMTNYETDESILVFYA